MDKEHEEQDEGQERPEVYVVKKDLSGWRFDRRTFLAAAGTAAAGATLGVQAGCSSPSRIFEQVLTEVAGTPTATQPPPEEPLPRAEPTQEAAVEPAATETSLPTREPTDAPTPTQPPTATSSPTPAVPKAKFIKDVTVPDGTVMEPTQAFTKTWQFQNVGAVSWGTGVQLAFVQGKVKGFESKKMAGPDAVDVPDVQAGKTVNVSVDLTAPENPGHYRSYWRLRLGNGEWLENPHFADIYVASKAELKEGTEGIQFKVQVKGQWITWTQPCGTPLPPGAVCICNCVSVPVGCACDQVCSCDQVCTCDTVCSCVGHEVCTCNMVTYWYPN